MQYNIYQDIEKSNLFFISKNSATQGEESHTSGIFVARELLSGVLAARLLTCSPVWVRRGRKQVGPPKKDKTQKHKSENTKNENTKGTKIQADEKVS